MTSKERVELYRRIMDDPGDLESFTEAELALLAINSSGAAALAQEELRERRKARGKKPGAIFNEDSLREEIMRVWGEHGAHMDIYDMLLREWRFAKQRDSGESLGMGFSADM